MRKNIYKLLILFTLCIFLINCSDDDIGISRIDRANSFESGIIETVLEKKGIGMSYKEITWSTRVARLKPFWHYSWNRDLRDEIPDSVEFVPMFWGTNSVNDSEIEKIKTLVDAGKIKYILGFNEPDLEGQANMTVDEAIALWPKLEEIGVPLGSPAPSGGKNGWLEEFMSKANQANLRVDFICLHLYKSNNPQLFLDEVDNIYEKYGKPIWITEMSVVDNQAQSVEDNRYSIAAVLGTMRILLPELYNRKYIHRFAWFTGTKDSPNYPRLSASILYDEDDNMTELGEYYSKYKPNPKSGSGSEPVIEVIEEVSDNILKNGTFETGKIDPWEGFKNAVISSSSQEPNTGNYLARIEPHDGSIFQLINVKPGKTYEFTFFHRWKSIPQNTFNVVIKDEEGDKTKFVEYEIEKTDTWTENSLEFTVPENVTLAKLVFYKPQLDPILPGFFLDDVVILEKQ